MLEAGAQQAVLEASAAREEPRDELPQALVSTTGHSQLPPCSFCLPSAGDPGVVGHSVAMAVPPASPPGEPGTARPSWHCHPMSPGTSYHRREPQGTARRTQHPHRHQGTATVTSAPAPAPLPHHLAHSWGWRETPGASSRWEAVAWSQDDAQAQLWLRKAGGMDQSSQLSTFPWLLTGSTGAWQGAGISVRGKLRQGQHLSSFPVSLPWLCYMSPQQ